MKTAINKYILWLKNHRKATTTQNAVNTLKDYTALENELTVDAIENYITALTERGNKPSSINTKLRTLRNFNKWAASRNLMDDISHLIEDIPDTQREKISVLTCEMNQHDIINRAKSKSGDKFTISRDVAIMNLFIVTGIRVSELINLKLTDLDFKNKLVKIRHGKGDKERTIGIADSTISVLCDYFKKIADIPNPEKLVFLSSRPSSNGSRKLSRSAVFKLTQRLTDGEYGCHKLRHLSATAKLNAGVPIDQVQDDLGHSNIATTKIYAERNFKSKLSAAVAVGI